MNRAPVGFQEMALRVARHPQPQQMLGPVHEAPLKFVRAQTEVLGDPRQVRLSQIDEAALLATLGAAWLALEPQAGHSAWGSPGSDDSSASSVSCSREYRLSTRMDAPAENPA